MRIPEKYAIVERGKVLSDGGFGEAEVVEVERPFASTTGQDEPLRVRVGSVPEDTVAPTPDDAAAMAIAMQKLSGSGGHQLGFKVEYFV